MRKPTEDGRRESPYNVVSRDDMVSAIVKNIDELHQVSVVSQNRTGSMKIESIDDGNGIRRIYVVLCIGGE